MCSQCILSKRVICLWQWTQDQVQQLYSDQLNSPHHMPCFCNWFTVRLTITSQHELNCLVLNSLVIEIQENEDMCVVRNNQMCQLSVMWATCCTMIMSASSCIVLMSLHSVTCHICTSTWWLPITTKLLMWNAWHPCEIWGPVPWYQSNRPCWLWLCRNMGLTLIIIYTLLTTFLWPGDTRKALLVCCRLTHSQAGKQLFPAFEEEK